MRGNTIADPSTAETGSAATSLAPSLAQGTTLQSQINPLTGGEADHPGAKERNTGDGNGGTGETGDDKVNPAETNRATTPAGGGRRLLEAFFGGSKSGGDGAKAATGEPPHSADAPRAKTPGSGLFGSLFGGGAKTNGGGRDAPGSRSASPEKKKNNNRDPKKPLPTPDVAVLRIQRQVRIRRAVVRVKAKREAVRGSQNIAARLVLWAVVSIQTRVARGPQGRQKFRKHKIWVAEEWAKKKLRSAVRIQSLARAVRSRVRVKKLLKEKREKEAQEKFAMEFANKKKGGKGGRDGVDDSLVGGTGGGQLSAEAQRQLDEKLKRLEEMEQAMKEREARMEEAARLADERSRAMEKVQYYQQYYQQYH